MAPRARELTVPRLLHVESSSLDGLADLLDAHEFDLGRRVLVGTGRGPSRTFAERAVTSLRGRGVEVLALADLSGRLDQAARAAAVIIEEGVGVAIAVGGGRVIDPVKLAAARTGIDFVSVPTTISNDGISSPVSSLVNRRGERSTHAARMPCGIVVDVDAIGTAPAPTLRAGVGDLISNLTACMDWRLADRLGEERFDAYSAMIAEAAARPALDLHDLDSRETHEILAHGLLLSGLAMAAAGTSRPCSGAEHLISHALDAQLGSRAALHGEQVAIGCLVSAAAHGSALLPELHRLYRRLGLPVSPEDLGLTRTELAEAVAAAPAIRPDRWTVLSERSQDPSAVDALIESALSAQEAVDDALGRATVLEMTERLPEGRVALGAGSRDRRQVRKRFQ
jgi:glycerol-1-phosphate dehydrogenase [NAD(P)+]